ncbi:hypothetical protein [Variovorax sp. 22077]|uniref:hypothetical protein n=1 Tax=Variovorax sp. 22077 TaxID=3453867 RepID=UPI003F836BAF
MAGLTAMNNRLQALQRDLLVPSTDDDYLFDNMPTLAEWQGATAVKVGARGKTNLELLQIDAQLLRYRSVLRGERADAIRRIRDIIGRWRLRRGPAAARSRRFTAMGVMDSIVTILCDNVVYDRAEWLRRHDYRAGPIDRIRGGFSENGATVQSLRKSLIQEFSSIGCAAHVNDSMNEADRRILDAFGLRPGAGFHGGAACFSAAAWAQEHVRGKIESYGDPLTIHAIGDLRVERNGKDTHRYTVDQNGVIVDPTWRQFFRLPQIGGTPAIFVGTIDDMIALVADRSLPMDKVAGIYSGTKVMAYLQRKEEEEKSKASKKPNKPEETTEEP